MLFANGVTIVFVFVLFLSVPFMAEGDMSNAKAPKELK